MKIKNSLGTFLEQAMVLSNNGMETIDKIGRAMASQGDTITLTLTDPNDSSKTVEYAIPSFGYLKSEIDRLSTSLETMSNITEGAGSRIRLSDGTYRRIIASKIPSEAPTISNIGNVTNFNFRSNWFFEDMLNPCLYITCDLTGQIDDDTERILVQRYILQCDTPQKVSVFNSQFKGNNAISYVDFLNVLIGNGIRYTLDDEIKDLPPRSKRYYGTFSVIRIVNEADANGVKVKRYVLDGIEFTDSRSGLENTRVLTVGDYVEVNSTPVTTRYEVIYVDGKENKIGLKCVEGCESVKIGTDTLKISSSQDTSVSADIPVGFDEREVIFVKSVDPDSNMPSSKWSKGVGFYTNELTYTASDGTVQTLQKFYQKNVIDFGQVLLSYAVDYYPSIREGITPDAPVLNYSQGTGDFKIVQINTQLTEVTDSETFRSLIADKSQVQSEINNMSNEIAKQKELIQTTQYVSTTEKQNAQSILNSLISSQESLMTNYNSIVNDIKTKYSSGISATPKYRVRGFWNMPTPKVSQSSGEQKIIKFKIRYRYLSESGNTNKEEEFQYTSGNTQVTGRFSNWNEIESKLRPRVKTADGWDWEDMDTADPETVNINQLDIPINAGEQVEIQVKSVSEAGWPSNPMESKWSDSIVVSFADFSELYADDLSEIIEQNKVDVAVANVQKSLSGASEHMSSSFYTNDKYFAHTAESITSGFLSPEQTPITLYDKLQELQNQITAIIEQINGAVGNLNVVLVDSSADNSDEQKIYTLNEGETKYIYAGDYQTAVSKLDEDKRVGAIITKTYYLDISADSQTGLMLLSKLSGNRLSMCPDTIGITNSNLDSLKGLKGKNAYSSYDNILSGLTSSSTYYKEQGRYDLVPINLTNTDSLDFQVHSQNMFQSAQCMGQFVYSRFRNIGDTFDMYHFNDDLKADNYENFDNCEYYEKSDDSSPIAFKYVGEIGKEINYYVKLYNEITGSNIKESTFEDDNSGNMLKNIKQIINRLPKLWDKDKVSINDAKITNKKLLLRIGNSDSVNINADTKVLNKLGKRIGSLKTNNMEYSIIPKIQAAYGYADMGTQLINASIDDDPSYLTTHKIGYADRDRYMSGEKSCGSFLFLSPINHEEIQVDGDSSTSSRSILNGESLRVPIVYQYRMTDYDVDSNGTVTGNIFGNSENLLDSETVKTTRYANIIGIDIWTDRNALLPKQYDIIVYSSYGPITTSNTATRKTSTQTLVDTGRVLATKLDKLVTDSKTLTGSTSRKISNSTNLKTRLL